MSSTPGQEVSGASPDRVLLADASEPFATRVEVLLSDAGYHVGRVRSVEEATPAALAEVDIVLLNAELPGGDSLVLARQWWQELDLPVILLSSHPDIDLKVRGFEMGAVDVVSQSVEGRELLARISRHLTVARIGHALRESEARLRSVTESAVDAIISADAAGNIRAWNRAAEVILGWSANEVSGKPLEVIIPDRFHEPHRAGMARINRGEPGRAIGHTMEVFARHRSGRELPIELSLATWIVDGERHFTGIIRDITERKQAERRLKLYADEITDKHAELNAQHAELMRSKDALARSLSQIQKLFAVVAEALEGQTIGSRYRLDRRLARGGFGVVYQGVDIEIGRDIAAKVLSPPRTGEGKAHLERFRREGVAALRVDHPNAVDVLDQGVTDAGLPYLIMELLSGETLRDRFAREGTIAVGDTIEIGADVAACLASVHAQGVVHRDITPSNIYLHRAPGDVPGFVTKVLDFGLAKLDAELGGFTVTRASEWLGTPHYVAPERVTSGDVGPPTDVYSLAVLLFEALVGELPFPPKADTWEVMYARVSTPPRPLRSLAPQLPAELETLIGRCLERDPASRPSAAELRQDLRRLAGTLPIADLLYRVPHAGTMSSDWANRTTGGTAPGSPS
jgi:PAS domain S-box-containing protein